MVSETTQSSPWLGLISDVQLKNPMRAHKRSEPLRFLLISFSCFLPQIPLFYQKQNELQSPVQTLSRQEALPQRGSRAGGRRGLLDVGQARRRVKNGKCWTTINADYDFFLMQGKERIVIWCWHLTGT